MCVMLLVHIFTLNAESQCPDKDDDVVHCSCFVLCDDEDCVLLSVMKC